MKRVACGICNETGWVHAQDVDDPFGMGIKTDDKCLNCAGKGYFLLHEGTISLIEKREKWFIERQLRMRSNSRWSILWPHNAA